MVQEKREEEEKDMTIAKGAVLTSVWKPPKGMTFEEAIAIPEVFQPFEIQELEWDELRDDEVAVRVQACGLCRSDWHFAAGEIPVEFSSLAGHEGGGIVEKVGKNVKRVKKGDKIIMSWMPSCGHCPPCVAGKGQLCYRGANLLSGMRDDGTWRIHDKKGNRVWQNAFLGAFSNYVVIYEDSCIPVDKDLDLTKIPIVGCRVPTGWGAVIHAAQATQGCTGLVIGLGGVGLNVIQGLKSVGARVIIAADIHDKKKWAMEFGATHYIDASKQDVVEEVMKITGIGVDFAFDAIGLGTVQAQTMRAVHPGGKAVWVGIAPLAQKIVELNTLEMSLFQKSAIGCCYGAASPFEMVPQLLEMYKAGHIKMDELITKEYRLEQINEAYADMLAGKNICGVIRFD